MNKATVLMAIGCLAMASGCSLSPVKDPQYNRILKLSNEAVQVNQRHLDLLPFEDPDGVFITTCMDEANKRGIKDSFTYCADMQEKETNRKHR